MYEFEVVASGQEEWESDTASVSVYVLKDDKSKEKRILKKLVDELFDLEVNNWHLTHFIKVQSYFMWFCMIILAITY